MNALTDSIFLSDDTKLLCDFPDVFDLRPKPDEMHCTSVTNCVWCSISAGALALSHLGFASRLRAISARNNCGYSSGRACMNPKQNGTTRWEDATCTHKIWFKHSGGRRGGGSATWSDVALPFFFETQLTISSSKERRSGKSAMRWES